MIPAPRSSWIGNISPGRAGIFETVDKMADIIRAGSVWPPLRTTALAIVAGCRERDFDGMAGAVYEWVQRRMVFRNDNFGVETLQTVPYLFEQIKAHGFAYGDCDDFTIMTGALLKVLGFPVKIRVIRYEMQGDFAHVVPVAYVRGHGWIELDGTVRSGEGRLQTPRAEIRDSAVIA